MPDSVSVLVVAHQTAANSALLEAVHERAQQGPARFHMVVPRPARMGCTRSWTRARPARTRPTRCWRSALPKLSEAAGQEVTGSIGDPEPLMAIHDAVNLGDYDEIIISTLPLGISRWLKLDLISKAKAIGLPVTHVAAKEREPTGVS